MVMDSLLSGMSFLCFVYYTKTAAGKQLYFRENKRRCFSSEWAARREGGGKTTKSKETSEISLGYANNSCMFRHRCYNKRKQEIYGDLPERHVFCHLRQKFDGPGGRSPYQYRCRTGESVQKKGSQADEFSIFINGPQHMDGGCGLCGSRRGGRSYGDDCPEPRTFRPSSVIPWSKQRTCSDSCFLPVRWRVWR